MKHILNDAKYLELMDILTVLKVTSGTLRRLGETGRFDPRSERVEHLSRLAISATRRLERVLIDLDDGHFQAPLARAS